MMNTRRNIQASYCTFLSVLAVAFFSLRLSDGTSFRALAMQQVVDSVVLTGTVVNENSQEYRIAQRLQKRLHKQGKVSPPLSLLTHAVQQRQAYLKNKVSMKFLTSDGTPTGQFELSFHAYPLWLRPNFSVSNARFDIDSNAITSFFENAEIPGAYDPLNVVLSNISDDEVPKADTTGVAKRGEYFDISSAVQELSNAFMVGESTIEVALQNVPGQIVNDTEHDLGELKLLASGKSNFRGSTYARMQNVRKALRSHVNNTVVPPGATFSFNSTLGGPVTESRGWHVAKVIFEGDQLRPAPGGGICQASTTVYRAIVNAGFPVAERRAHSLYVSYYKQYGVGIDATIFPGYQDLTFINDTGKPLLIQAYDDGYDAVVNIYGTDDGREVELHGPYFSTNAPEGFTVYDRKIASNEVAWVQKVTYRDGATKENIILSRYKQLPLYVKNEFAFVE